MCNRYGLRLEVITESASFRAKVQNTVWIVEVRIEKIIRYVKSMFCNFLAVAMLNKYLFN